jgi:hypothetical protein
MEILLTKLGRMDTIHMVDIVGKNIVVSNLNGEVLNYPEIK